MTWIRSNILGLVAIFIALSGTAVATGVTGVTDDQGAQSSAKKSKRGPAGPPGAAGAQGPTGPAGAQGATGSQGVPGQNGSPDTGGQILTKLAPVDGSGSSLDADSIDGVDSTAFATKSSEAWIELGTAVTGTCASNGNFCDLGTTCAWGNLGGNYSTGGYYRDSAGVVHLKGVVKRTNVSCGGFTTKIIFVLPPGYRPAKDSIVTVTSNDALGVLYIYAGPTPGPGPAGSVLAQAGAVDTWITLDNVSFRCQPSGVNGCP